MARPGRWVCRATVRCWLSVEEEESKKLTCWVREVGVMGWARLRASPCGPRLSATWSAGPEALRVQTAWAWGC